MRHFHQQWQMIPVERRCLIPAIRGVAPQPVYDDRPQVHAPVLDAAAGASNPQPKNARPGGKKILARSRIAGIN
jgi:hypothetical protein